ncbi:MAG: hypothetical protein JJT78_01795 [Leptospira sp.]|nr:hypothetical protein [Leptospira sp.]
MIQERKPLNPYAFFASIFFLSVVFFIYLKLRPIPADPETYVYLANLRALTETDSLFGIEEPLSILLLYFWKNLFSLNYLTAFQSISSLLFSISLHLILLFFRKGDWKLNHYFLVYLAAFLPYSHEFPVVYFNELLAVLFVLLIFHTFRMETILDLFLFPLLVVAAFFADLRVFLFGFSIFVVIYSFKASQKMKSKTTVFYKRKNIPMILLFSYFGAFSLFLILASWNDFFSTSSFFDLVIHWGVLSLYIIPSFIAIVLGNILLNTEKELRTKTFTIILGLSTIAVILFNYSNYDANVQNELESEKEAMIRVQPMLSGITHTYTPMTTANYVYFKTKITNKYINKSEIPTTSVLWVDQVWEADINEIKRKYAVRGRRAAPEVFPLGERTALIPRSIEEKILAENISHPLQNKVIEARQKISKITPYLSFLEWQQNLIGYGHLQD